MQNKSLKVLCNLCFLIFCAVSVSAKESSIKMGKIDIVSSITVNGVYDDNIYLGNNTTEPNQEDMITHVDPGFLFRYRMGVRGDVSLGYAGNFAFYADNSDSNWNNNTGYMKLRYDSPGGLILGIDETFKYKEDPYGNLAQFRLGLKTKRWNNDLQTKLGFKFSDQFKILGYYDFYTQEYDLEMNYSQNYNEHQFGVGFETKIHTRTWGFIRYYYGNRDYSSHTVVSGVNNNNDADYNWHSARIGVNWDASPKLDGEINVGYQWVLFNNEADVGGFAYQDKDMLVADTSVTYTPFTNSSFKLQLFRALRSSGAGTARFFEETGFGLDYQQKFLTAASFRIGGTYSQDTYNMPESDGGEDREDDNIKFTVGLDYQILEWLRAGIAYQYWKKDSNYAYNDYTDNRFTGLIGASY
jgi:hypothetical protein